MTFPEDIDGIRLDQKHFVWCRGHGHLRWAPHWLKRAIVAVWNRIACAAFGHVVFGPWEETDDGWNARRVPVTCMHCSKTWPIWSLD